MTAMRDWAGQWIAPFKMPETFDHVVLLSSWITWLVAKPGIDAS